MSKLKDLKDLIDVSLQRPGRSKLTNAQFDVGGFISPNTRHFYNNLGSMSTHTFELGSHIGSSLVSTVYGNDNIKSATACDNFSLFTTPEQDVRQDFYNNCERHIKGRYKMLEKDGFTLTFEDLPNPIDLYIKDGDHSYESEYLGVTKIAKFFAEECIMVVDDMTWHSVSSGTFAGIKDAGLKVDYMGLLWNGQESDCGPTGWWNGMGVFLIKR